MKIPGATYRLQFNKQFRFPDAVAIVDYLSKLGISDVYSSPIFTAPPESNHGYDVSNYNELNPALGSAHDWEIFTTTLRQQGMGLLLDFVPNHMGASAEYNPWWRDVLEFGTESLYARFFDIDWDSSDPQLTNHIVLPVLEDHYGTVLENGLLKIGLRNGGFEVRYRNLALPLHPRSYQKLLKWIATRKTVDQDLEKFIQHSSVLGTPANRESFQRLKDQLGAEPARSAIESAFQEFEQSPMDAAHLDFLDDLLSEQTYRLVVWRTGTHIANYRRFFDVDSLIAVNMSRPEVFDTAHHLVSDLIQKGQVTGLRIDHIDGLADPKSYLENVQAKLAPKAGTAAASGRFYVLVEKILMNGENLPADWPTAGTTGYDFGAAVMNVLIDAAHEQAFTRIYQDFVSNQISFAEILKQDKRWMMAEILNREIAELTHLLQKCATHRRADRDLLPEDLTRAIVATIENFDVYRTYVVPRNEISPADRRTIKNSLQRASEVSDEVDPAAFQLLHEVLLADGAGPRSSETDDKLFRRRFQQFSGPIMAKSYEDTAFFVYNRLIALNEVGGNPARFGISLTEFHRFNTEHLRDLPHAMLTTSSHDTKTSEDARSRVAAISQLPSLWADFIAVAASANAPFRTCLKGALAPDRNEEYLLYQILLATWPPGEMNATALDAYTRRVQRHMLKALREAKIHTRWDRQNRDWEKAVEDFIFKVINLSGAIYAVGFKSFADSIAQLGMVNSLSQTLLKLTCPGVPDIYQGNELWQFLLTDPDNRGTIDFALRRRVLASLDGMSPAEMLKNWRDGAIKLFLTRTILNFRRTNPLLFAKGDYVPLEVSGGFKECCVAFARVYENQHLIIVAPRLAARVGIPPVADVWQDTVLNLTPLNPRSFVDLFTSRTLQGDHLPLKEVLNELPFAALTG